MGVKDNSAHSKELKPERQFVAHPARRLLPPWQAVAILVGWAILAYYSHLVLVALLFAAGLMEILGWVMLENHADVGEKNFSKLEWLSNELDVLRKDVQSLREFSEPSDERYILHGEGERRFRLLETGAKGLGGEIEEVRSAVESLKKEVGLPESALWPFRGTDLEDLAIKAGPSSEDHEAAMRQQGSIRYQLRGLAADVAGLSEALEALKR
jgi:hypothetical protein